MFEGDYSYGGARTLPSYDVAADGERFLMVKDLSASRGNVRVVINWFEELRRLVPADH